MRKIAIDKYALDSKLIIDWQTGTDNEGKPITTTRSFSDVKPEATDQDMYDFCLQLHMLGTYTLRNIIIREDSVLEEGL